MSPRAACRLELLGFTDVYDQVMEPGPVTVRPHEPLDRIATRLRDHHLTTQLVTDPEGHLLGLVHRDDLPI